MQSYKIYHDLVQFATTPPSGLILEAKSNLAAFKQFLSMCNFDNTIEIDRLYVYVQNIKTKKGTSYEVGIECKPVVTKLDHQIGTIDGDFFHLF
jgi:hypothetical protein